MSKFSAEFKVLEALSLLETPVFDEEERDTHREATQIDLCRLNDCCVDQVNLIMTYGSNYELAVAEESALKAAVERAYAELDPQARSMLESGGTKPTEAKVDSIIKVHPEYVELQTKYLAAQKNTGMWKAARDAVMHRKDMLVQLAANYRAENTGEVSINQKIANAQEILKRKKG